MLRSLVGSEMCIRDRNLKIPDVTQMTFPSREIHLPIALADRWTQAAVDQYRSLVRPRASYLPSNVDFLAANNGLASADEACATLTNSKWLVVGVGFYLGCPFAIPFDPRCRLEVPKYNPARTYTPDGAVGMGGPYLAIYPIECPGGYQLFGRTIPTWETFGTRDPFTANQPWLLSLFDTLVWEPVSEDELEQIRRDALAGRYTYDIREATFDMQAQKQFEDSVSQEVEALRSQQDRAQEAQREIEAKILAELDVEKASAPPAPPPVQIGEGMEVVEADLSGTVLKLLVGPGDTVVEDETVVCVVEAMKMEVQIKSGLTGSVGSVLVGAGQVISSGDPICTVAPK
eukprot:TRINITY_DN21878_c0_g1_i2.p1 TRINITY_DN21878_c0_g1~~TRINITY_DN21878_c0_g1_i2.p1  ORF type:complete len:345 (+),score=87.95 TRINITY_DN21878_c0_g1_i2:122-1156(+)